MSDTHHRMAPTADAEAWLDRHVNWKARAERAEAILATLFVPFDVREGMTSPQEIAERSKELKRELYRRAEKAEKERDAARAACAEMRAALEAFDAWHRSPDSCVELQTQCANCDALFWAAAHELESALSLEAGRGWVSPEEHEQLKEELEAARKHVSGHDAWSGVAIRLHTENKKLRAELKEAREALQAEEGFEVFDCPHDAEQQCRCGAVESELIEKARSLRKAVLSKGGAQ